MFSVFPQYHNLKKTYWKSNSNSSSFGTAYSFGKKCFRLLIKFDFTLNLLSVIFLTALLWTFGISIIMLVWE